MNSEKIIENILSIIIPVYNVREYIVECLESIVSQSYYALEIIIIDDGSIDGTSEICRKYAEADNRIVYLKQNNAGVTSARLKGVEISKGKYVTFIDADDYILANMFEKMMEFAFDYDLVCCGIIYGKRSKILLNEFVGAYKSEDNMKIVWSKMIYDVGNSNNNPLHPGMYAKIYKRELVLPILSRMDKCIVYGEDAVCVYSYLLQCKSVYFLDEAFYYYRFREDSVVNSKNEQMLENINRVYINLKYAIEQHSFKNILIEQLEKWIINMTIDAINKYMGFSYKNRLIRFWIDLDEFQQKKVIIYGAGEMGRDMICLLKRANIDCVAWIDKEYNNYQMQGLCVDGIEILKEIRFDVILIAVSNGEVAKEIYNNLINEGVSKDKIIWKKPIILV